MSIKKQSEQQIYGRNDMVNIEPNKKIYGSLGKTEKWFLNTVEGNPVTMANSRKGSFEKEVTEFDLYGWSKQETTTGVNLFNANDVSKGYVSDDSGNNIVATNSYCSNFITVSAKTKYYLYSGQDRGRWGAFYDSSKTFISGISPDKYNTVFETPENAAYVRFTVNYNNNNPDFARNVIFAKSTVALPFEPYTGGKPSPSPEYPQEIVSAGEKGSIGVEITGKNLFDLSKEYTSGNVVNTFTFTLKPITKYTLSTDFPATVNVASIYFGGPSSNINGVWKDRPKTFATDSSGNIIVHIRTLEQDNAPAIFNDVLNGVYHIQLEEGNTATSYEPYKQPQSLPITTPTGLSAIPVPSGTSGITYTDADGQAWIADYIDLKRGKLVKKLKRFTISDVKTISTWGVNENADNITGFYFYTSENGLPKTNNDVMISTILQYDSNVWGGKNVGCAMSSDIHNNYAILSVPTNMLEDISSDENACASLVKICENTNAIFFYSMASPIETDLTPEEIETYKNLVTYAGTTIVENDTECYMKITYMAKGS